MIRFILACSLVAVSASGQSVFAQIHRKVPPAAFASCVDVESTARELAKDVPDRIYAMELFPSDQYSLFVPFVSEVSPLQQALAWLSKLREQVSAPRAILYFVDGRYTFRCRDDHDHFSESYGADGDPLRLKIAAGKADIWYFSRTPQGMAHVYIVTDRALDEVDGADLMLQVKQQLRTHFIFAYVRNDPWFLGTAMDFAPFIFAGDKFKAITEQEYQDSKTMLCRTDIGCKVWPNKQ
jgi:hypothetical protein